MKKNVFDVCMKEFGYRLMTGLAMLLLFLSCGKTMSRSPEKKRYFTPPEIPSTLTSPQERASFAVTHYWDSFDFTDTIPAGKTQLVEQIFVDYINLFPQTSPDVVEKSIDGMLRKSVEKNSKVFDHLFLLFDKYLYDPNSPFRQEDYFIAVLRSVISNPKVDELSKVRPKILLETALKNRPGEPASDFEYSLSNGKKAAMTAISADYLLMFFNNPGCHDCARIKGYLESSPIFQTMMQSHASPSLRVLAVFSDEDIALWRKAVYPSDWINGRCAKTIDRLYDLKAIPCLYLLDKNKRVILKDAPVEAVEQWLKSNASKK